MCACLSTRCTPDSTAAPILDANTLAAMLIASMYNGDGEMQVPGVAAEEPVGGLQRDLDEADVRRDAGILPGYRLAGTGSLASRLWTKPSVTVIGFDAQPVEGSFNVISHETTFRLSLRTAPNQRPEQAQQALADFLVAHAPFGCEVTVTPRRERHGLGHGSERGGHQGRAGGHGGGLRRRPGQQGRGAARSRSSRICSASSPRRRCWSPDRRIRRPTRTARTSPSRCRA